MTPDFPRVTSIKKHVQFDCGAGTLASYYEQGVNTQGSKRIKYDTSNHFSGPLPLFPQLDVMAGDASAINDGYNMCWDLTPITPKNIDVAVLNYEETLGGMQGFKISNNTGFEDESFNQYAIHDPRELFGLSGDNIDEHSGQAPHGRHEIDLSIAGLSAMVASQHNVGDAQEGRDSGLERADNPAVNAQESGKGETYENTDTLDVNAPVAVPMDVDAIEINGVVTYPMDVDVALGANQTS